MPGWATLFTGATQDRHGLAEETQWEKPVTLRDLRLPSVWELLPPQCRVGLLAVPLALPPVKVPGWVVAGYPAGLLAPELVQPAGLAPVALAANYRTDFLLSEFESQTFAHRLETDIRSEAVLYQTERNKLTTAMALPAVEVMVVGFSVLEYIQQTRELAHYNTFSAYQQVYGWIESMLAALRPENFAVLSQRGYPASGTQAQRGGFYCLSWLKGENSRANMTDIAPEILKLMGGDLSRLGRPR
jgi:predicted AlkP superfamily phosphohydrolase/phosphomutase